MSAVNIIRQSAAVHVITDGAAYDAGGEIGGLMCKAVPIPHLSLIVAARGPALAPVMFSAAMMSLPTYDAVKLNAVEVVRAVAAMMGEAWREHVTTGAAAEITIAGFSELHGPDAYAIVTQARKGGPAPYTLVGIPQTSFSPGDPEILAAIHVGLPAGASSTDDLDIDHEAVRILELQRAAGFRVGNREPNSIVGGFAQLTTVTRDGITTRILKRWPEEHIGKKLGQKHPLLDGNSAV